MRSVVTCETSSGWIAMMTGAFFSSLMSMTPRNIAQSLMLKAGMAKLFWLAMSRMDLPVYSTTVDSPVGGGGERRPCGRV